MSNQTDIAGYFSPKADKRPRELVPHQVKSPSEQSPEGKMKRSNDTERDQHSTSDKLRKSRGRGQGSGEPPLGDNNDSTMTPGMSEEQTTTRDKHELNKSESKEKEGKTRMTKEKKEGSVTIPGDDGDQPKSINVEKSKAKRNQIDLTQKESDVVEKDRKEDIRTLEGETPTEQQEKKPKGILKPQRHGSKDIPKKSGVKEKDERVVTTSNTNKETNPKADKEKREISKDRQLTMAEVVKRNPHPILQQFKAHRISVSFPIDKPASKAKRMSALCRALNKFMQIAKSVAHKTRTVYVRKFQEHLPPKDTDKIEWIKEFDKTKMAHLAHYTHGFYPYQPLQARVFRLRLQVMIPVQDEVRDFIMNTNELFGKTDDWRVQNIDAQNLHDPVDVGWLFRSSWVMTSSTELRDVLQKKAKKYKKGMEISLVSKTISPPGTYVYDKETAVNGVVVSCNSQDLQAVTDFMFQTYNKGKPPPLQIPMKFIPTKDHPEVKNNAVALQNLSILIDRQRVFKTKTQFIVCQHLAFPDEKVESGKTLREVLMDLSPQTTSEEMKEARLFHAIVRQGSTTGTPLYYFLFHDAFALEASSIISNLGVFLRDELELDPEAYCYPSLINPTHKWDASTRTCITQTGTFMNDLVGETADLCINEEQSENVQEEMEMTSKEGREFRRTVGLDDTETITDLKTKRKPKSKVPTQVTGDARSVRSELSGLTNHSPSTKASLQRKELRATVAQQKDEMATKDDEIEKLKAALEDLKRPSIRKHPPPQVHQAEDNEDDISYSDSNIEETTEKRSELAEYPMVSLEGCYDIHNYVMYPRNPFKDTEFMDKDKNFPLHNPYGDPEILIDPHWDYIGEYVKDVAWYVMEQELKKDRIVMASRTGTKDRRHIAVYIWCVMDCYYTTSPDGENPYPASADVRHVLERSDFIKDPVYPFIEETEEEMELFSEDTLLHNPTADPTSGLHDHWVKFTSAPVDYQIPVELEYREKGFRTLVSRTRADEPNHVVIYLWAQGMDRFGEVTYARESNSTLKDTTEEKEWVQEDSQESSQQDSGQSSSSQHSGERNTVSFDQYKQVQQFSTADGGMIGVEEDHSISDGLSGKMETEEHHLDEEEVYSSSSASSSSKSSNSSKASAKSKESSKSSQSDQSQPIQTKGRKVPKTPMHRKTNVSKQTVLHMEKELKTRTKSNTRDDKATGADAGDKDE